MLAGECNKIHSLSIINRSFTSHEPKMTKSLLEVPPCSALLVAGKRNTALDQTQSHISPLNALRYLIHLLSLQFHLIFLALNYSFCIYVLPNK